MSQHSYAGVVTRGIALMIDLILISTVVFIFTLVFNVAMGFFGLNVDDCAASTRSGPIALPLCWTAEWIRRLVTILFLPVYFIFFWSLRGLSPGKALMGLRIVRMDGKKMTVKRAFLRLIGYFACVMTFGLGFLWAVVDARRQGLEDKIARTFVVYATKEKSTTRSPLTST